MLPQYSHDADEDGFIILRAGSKDLCVKQLLPELCFLIPESKIIKSFSGHYFLLYHKNPDHDLL